jgi:hypothetical protein
MATKPSSGPGPKHTNKTPGETKHTGVQRTLEVGLRRQLAEQRSALLAREQELEELRKDIEMDEAQLQQAAQVCQLGGAFLSVGRGRLPRNICPPHHTEHRSPDNSATCRTSSLAALADVAI